MIDNSKEPAFGRNSLTSGEEPVESHEGVAAADEVIPPDEDTPTLEGPPAPDAAIASPEETPGPESDPTLEETPDPDVDVTLEETGGSEATAPRTESPTPEAVAVTEATAGAEDAPGASDPTPTPEAPAPPALEAPAPPATRPPPALLAVGPSGAEPVYARGVAPTLRALRRSNAPITWLHAESSEDLLPALEEFGLHELAVRSLRDGPERPRVEEYPDHLYVSLLRAGVSATALERAGRPAADGTNVRIEELRVFLGERWIVSLGPIGPEEHASLTEVVVRQVMDRGRGPSFVLYYLAEWVVETLYPLLDSLDDRVDSLEDLVLLDTGEQTRQELFRLKRDLVELRRRVAPTRDVMQRLSGHGLGFVEPEAEVFFRDVHDDVLLVLEQLDTHRDILSSALDLHLSTVSNRLNEVMKRLTLVATLFMPITFITGFFGMNFSGLPITSMAWYWGTVAAMTAAFVGMAGYAWRRGWF
ncbi:MAG: hypothetical protein KKA32_10395 [Actinobacteria bacterium]|nr:hypothetical protein [Actinomycetota bacterium]